MRSVGRGDLTDQQWRQIEPLLPAQKPRIGRPSKDHSTTINGILWVLRTGAPWRDPPEGYGPWPTVASWFYRWRKQGLRRQKEGGDQALGRSQGGFGTKVHVLVEGMGKPVTVVLTPGQQHEATVFEQLMTGGVVKRPGGGRPRIPPQRVCGDKGYSSSKIRSYLRRRGIRNTIPRKRIERRTGPCQCRRRHLRGH